MDKKGIILSGSILLGIILLDFLLHFETRKEYGFSCKEYYNFNTVSTKVDLCDIDIKNTLIVCRFSNWAKSPKNFAFIMNMSGDIKYIDIHEYYPEQFNNKDITNLYDRRMNDDNMSIYKKIKEPSKDIQECVENINHNKLRFSSGYDGTADAGVIEYSLIIGTERDRRILVIRETGDHTYIPRDTDVIKISKYVDKTLRPELGKIQS